jgi:hypothetical protein
MNKFHSLKTINSKKLYCTNQSMSNSHHHFHCSPHKELSECHLASAGCLNSDEKSFHASLSTPKQCFSLFISLLGSEGSFQTTTIPNEVIQMIFVCSITISLRTIRWEHISVLSLSLISLGFHLVCYRYFIFCFFLAT